MTGTQRRACRLAETAADPEAYERAHVAMRNLARDRKGDVWVCGFCGDERRDDEDRP
jgi:hypothetical protein